MIICPGNEAERHVVANEQRRMFPVWSLVWEVEARPRRRDARGVWGQVAMSDWQFPAKTMSNPPNSQKNPTQISTLNEIHIDSSRHSYVIYIGAGQ